MSRAKTWNEQGETYYPTDKNYAPMLPCVAEKFIKKCEFEGMPLISVIVPVYRVEPYLHRCIDSILAQTFTDFELVLIDDGSPDNCGTMCDEYAIADSRAVIIHKKNGGVSLARNCGLDLTTGQYVMFIDSDDFVESNYLMLFSDNRIGTELVLAPPMKCDATGKCLRCTTYENKYYRNKEEIDYVYLCDDKIYSPYCILFCRDVIYEENIRFPVNITWGEDGIFVVQYLRYVNSMRVLSNSGYHYINNEKGDSLSTKIREDIVDTIVLARETFLHDLLEITRDNRKEITDIVEKDLRKNCAYFVERTILCNNMSLGEKEKLINRFMKHTYVTETIQSAEKYYYNWKVQYSLKFNNPTLAYTIIDFMYRHFYIRFRNRIIKIGNKRNAC